MNGFDFIAYAPNLVLDRERGAAGRRCCRVSTMETLPILDNTVTAFSRTLFGSRGRARAALFSIAILAVACQPTVKVEVPREPITINLNIKLDAEVRVKIEEQADKDIDDNPDIF